MLLRLKNFATKFLPDEYVFVSAVVIGVILLIIIGIAELFCHACISSLFMSDL